MKKILSFLSGFSALFLTTLVFAQEHAGMAGGSGTGTIAIGAALAIGLAALGGTLGQGKAAAAALEGIARNPGAASKVQTPMILGLALIESLVLASWAIAYLLLGKI
ncbi:MAG: ATP synthase F0 subunit C [Deltaproteobacteria bacterium]|nr:ATP synthase F0 subunit C [Deltaproteobacteria bacterium]